MDENGNTPSDLALSPSAWVLWCNSLDAAGLKPHDILQKDDKINRITLNPGYLERQYQKILNSRPPEWTVEMQQFTHLDENSPTCAYCGLPDEWTPQRAQFDYIGSYLVQMAESCTHAAFANHKDGTHCMNGGRRSSCLRQTHKRDGEISDWSPKSLSLRKHTARQLWEDGILSEPATAYVWATGLSHEWITTNTS